MELMMGLEFMGLEVGKEQTIGIFWLEIANFYPGVRGMEVGD